MTSKVSSNSFHPARNLFKYSIRQELGITVLASVFMLLICPGYILMYIQNAIKHSSSGVFNFNSILPNLIMFVTVLTTAVAILFLYINFNFLYSKNASDLYHSLPINRQKLLISRFFASTVPVLIPITLIYISMFGITVLKNVEANIKTIVLGLIYNVLIMLMCSMFTMIFIICSGSVLDLLISFISINAGGILAVLVGAEIAKAFLVGFTDGTMKDLLMYSSPFYFSFAYFAEFLSTGFKVGSGIVIFTVKIIIMTIIMWIVAMLLYNHRKSERSSVCYAYKFIYILSAIVISFIGAYALGIIFSNGDYNIFFWVFAAVGALLCAITFGVINERDFKTVKKSCVIGICSFAILALEAVIMFTGCFGFSGKMPSQKTIESVLVTFEDCSVDFKDPSLAMMLHDEAIKDKMNSNSEDYQTITFNYKLKAGRSLERSFNVAYDKHIDLLLKIYKSDENINGIVKNFNEYKGKNISISKYDYADNSDNELVDNVPLSYAELKKIVNAYCEDILSSTEKIIKREDVTEYSIGAVDEEHHYSYNSIYLEDGYTKTNEVINSLNLPKRASSKE